MLWLPDRIEFASYYGDYPQSSPADSIETWTYAGPDIPPAGGENARMNFWLLPPFGSLDGTPAGPPTDGQEAEIVIRNFKYIPIAGDINDNDKVDLFDFALFAENWLIGLD